MDTRMKLFDRYLFPSMQHQTCRNFTWVLCFDEQTPDEIIARYDYCDNIEIAYCQPKDHVPAMSAEAPWIITSRIDNDDFYLPTFVEVIQQNFTPEAQILDIEYYQWDNRKGKGQVYTSGRYAPNSPFISLIEPWEKPISAYGHEHTRMPDYFPARKIDTPLAVQMIHEHNITNRIRGGLLTDVRIQDSTGCNIT